MFASFILIFFSLFFAQMGDKTQLLTILLATKTKKHFRLFVAIMTAFTLSVALAVIFGAGLRLIIPHNILHIVSGSLFILLGIFLIRDGKKKKDKYERVKLTHPFMTAMVLTFLADFGDKTQVALTLFAAANSPFIVFAAGILALGANTFLVIIFYRLILKKIKVNIIERLAGILFVLAGIVMLLG